MYQAIVSSQKKMGINKTQAVDGKEEMFSSHIKC